MAFEYQQMDVLNEEVSNIIQWMSCFGWGLKSNQRIYNRTQRPVGAVTYQNVTYVHSVTDIDDFTELLFERDLDIPFYDEIRELEREANELLEYSAEKRPLPLPPPKSYHDWFREYKPSPITRGKRAFWIFAPAGALSVAATVVVGALSGYTMAQTVFLLLAIGSVLLSLITCGITLSILRVCNRDKPESPYYKKMYAEYESYCDAIEEKNKRVTLYDRANQRIPEILREVHDLLEQ